MKIKKDLLIGILLFSAILRLYKLGTYPPSLNIDEVSAIYNFPIKIFALNEFMVRLPSALFSVFMVFAVYLLVLRLFKNQKPALISAFVLSLSPMAIHMGRFISIPRLLSLNFLSPEFIKNYLGYFTNEVLFERGAISKVITPYAIPNHGLLSGFEYPLLLLGITYLLKKFNKSSKIILVLLAVAPLFPVLTPVLSIIVGSGIFYAFELIKKRLLKTFLAVALIMFYVVFSLEFLVYYFTVYPQKFAYLWQYQFKELSSYLSENGHKYDKIIVTKVYDKPEIFLAYYQNNRTLSDKYIFKYPKIEDLKNYKSTLFIGGSNEFPEGIYLLKKIVLPNNEVMFKITDSNLIEQSIKDGKIKL